MKTLLIIRHAKSSWANHSQSDFERPLNERGNRDAPKMAARLVSKKIKIDAFISSTAIRAKETCEHFCAVYGVDADQIQWMDALYHASADTIHQVLAQINDKYQTVAIFCHNPGITDFVNDLVEDVVIDDIPTCGIFAASAEIQSWSAFSTAKKSFLFFDYPKHI
jgi:phosphohistidine phosphatase